MLLEAVSSCIQLFEVKFRDSTKLKTPKCKSPIFLQINLLLDLIHYYRKNNSRYKNTRKTRYKTLQTNPQADYDTIVH